MLNKEKKVKKDESEIALENLNPPDSVPYYVYRLEIGQRERDKKRLLRVIIIQAIIAFVLALIVAGFAFYEAQLEDYVFTQEVDQQTDQGGDNQNNFYYGDYNGEAKDQNNNQEAG